MGGEEGKDEVAHVGLHPSVVSGHPGEIKLLSPALRNTPNVQRLAIPRVAARVNLTSCGVHTTKHKHMHINQYMHE